MILAHVGLLTPETFVLFEATRFVVLGHSGHSKLYTTFSVASVLPTFLMLLFLYFLAFPVIMFQSLHCFLY